MDRKQMATNVKFQKLEFIDQFWPSDDQIWIIGKSILFCFFCTAAHHDLFSPLPRKMGLKCLIGGCQCTKFMRIDFLLGEDKMTPRRVIFAHMQC